MSIGPVDAGGPVTGPGKPPRRVLVPTIAGRPVPRGFVGAGRALLRGYGKATAPVRPLPDFVLIGAKRCGTTSFYFHLLRHPSVLPMFPSARLLPKARDGKGPHFFDNNYERGLSWYRGHFPSSMERRIASARTAGPVVTGEASPYYLYHPLAAGRAAIDLPHTRLLVLLRDPVERTYSHYREQRRNGAEALDFDRALEAEASRTAGEEDRLLAGTTARSFAHEQQSYVRQSEYVRGLRRWLDQFPRHQLLVQPSELYYTDPAEACRVAYEFLGVPPAPSHGGLLRLNAAPTEFLHADLRRRLTEHFEPFNSELEELLGQRFPWSRP